MGLIMCDAKCPSCGDKCQWTKSWHARYPGDGHVCKRYKHLWPR